MTIAGQTGWMLVHQAKWQRRLTYDANYFHDPQRIRGIVGEMSPEVDVAVTLLCFKRDAEAIVLRAVMGTDGAQDVGWAEKVLMSLRMPAPTQTALASNQQDTDAHKAQSGVLYERVFTGCSEGGFDKSTSSTFYDGFHVGPVGQTSEDTYRVDKIVMLARWEWSGKRMESFRATIARSLGSGYDGHTEVVVRKGACLSQYPEACEAIVDGPIELKDGLHTIKGPVDVMARLSCEGRFIGGSPMKVFGVKLSARAPEGGETKLFDNWNDGGCNLTSVAQFSLARETLLNTLDTWVHWPDVQGGTLDARLIGTFGANADHSLTFRKGACHPNMPDWCYGQTKPDILLAAGRYQVIAEHGAMCMNSGSGNKGYMRGSGVVTDTD